MHKLWEFVKSNAKLITLISVLYIILFTVLLYRLGSLTKGLSLTEVNAANGIYGWHGIYHDPYFLLLKIFRSIAYWLYPNHTEAITRLPNVFVGIIAVTEFGLLVKLWHGKLTALLIGILFFVSAWMLHVSRLATNDVMYLLTIPTLLLINISLYRYGKRAAVWYASILALAMLLYVPGIIWLYIPSIYYIRKQIIIGWNYFSKLWQRIITVLIIIASLPLLIVNLTRPHQFITWLGLPNHFVSISIVLKHFIGVPVHLFIRGPEYPYLWLGRTPILDFFSLITTVIGIYYYVKHLKAERSQLIAILFIISWILVALNGPVPLSLLVPLLYIFAAMGTAYLIREWLKVFPLNPIARGIGITLLAIVIALAGIYNMREYFIAWPHNSSTRLTFQYHR